MQPLFRLRSFVFYCCICFIALHTAPLLAQEQISVEWIYSGKTREFTALPLTHWCADGTAIIYDARKPAAERVFEALNPKSGARTPLCDMAKARASMKALRGTETIGWPTFNAQGSYGLLDMGDELVLFDVKAASFKSIIKGANDEYTRFSPDGQKIAFVRGSDIYIYDIQKQAETRLTSDGSETVLNGVLSWVYWEEVFDRSPEGYYWSEDSKSLAFFQSDESPVSVVTFPDFKPAVPNVLTQRYPKVGGANPKVRMGIIDLDKPSQPRWVELAAAGSTSGYAGSDPKCEYIVRATWLPDNKRLCVQTLARDQRELTLLLADRVTGKSTKLLTETDSGWVNVHDNLHFLKDNKHFLWTSERTGYNHIYRYTLDGKLVNAVTKGNWAAGEARGGAVTAVDEAKGIVYFKAGEKSSIERHLYSVKLDGSGMKRLTEEAGSHNVKMAENATYFFDTFSTVSTPPALRLHSADGKRVQELAASRTEAIKPLNLQFPTFFTIPCDGGFQMPAQILKPRDFDPNKRYPVIIYVYGGPSAPNVVNGWQRDIFYYQLLANAGYLVVYVDNRSAAAISKTYENTCVKQLAGDSELGDLLAGVRWLKQQSYVDSSRIGVWGWSFGGCFTLLAMTHSQEFKAGIAVAAPTDWRFYDTKYTESFMKTPQENAAGYEKTNLNARAKNLHGRLLLVHGTGDDNVHPQNAWNFIDELIKANKHFDLMMYPMRKHGIGDAPARIHLYNQMIEFWKKNL
jgi:dipeptidyl-peptidase-4